MRKILARIKSPYSINRLDENTLIVGSESDGELLLLRGPDYKSSIISKEPGGFMTVLPFNTRENYGVMAIGNFKPIFKGEDAGVYVYYPDKGISKEWKMRKILGLPFVHRIEVIQIGGKRYLVSATICGGKDFQDDWEKPGAVYVSDITHDDIINEKIAAKPIPGLKLRKNYGLLKTSLKDYQKEGLLVSAREGVFFIIPPQDDNQQWTWERLIDSEISDIFAFDIDNCDWKEIVALEPFHGNVLTIHKKGNSSWKRFEMDSSLNFGHVVWAGIIKGKSRIITGSRRGDEELSIYSLENADTLQFSKKVISKNVGASQLVVGNMDSETTVFCTCTKNNEVIAISPDI